MALGSSNISLAAVRTLLGYSSDFSLFNICKSSLINKWSKYKPVRGTYPQSSNSRYGLSLPRWNNAGGVFYHEVYDQGDAVDTWYLLKPRGGSPGGAIDEPGRLGDFRQYEHSTALTFPPIYCKSTDVDENPVLSPAQPSGGASSISATGKFNPSTTTPRISISNLGLGGYYFGILIITPTGGKWIKTSGGLISSSNESTGITISVSAALDDPTDPDSTYQNLPYGVGNFTAYYVISSSSYASWTQNPSATIYKLPGETVNSIVLKNHYTFEVEEWVYASASLSFAYDDSSTAGWQEVQIFISHGAEPFTITKPSWISYRVYTDSIANGGTNITGTPSAWDNGYWIRFFPNTEYSLGRTGTIYIGGTDATSYPISVEQRVGPATVVVQAGNPSVLTVSGVSGHVTGGLYISFTPHYVPNNDPAFDVCWYIKVNGVDAYSSETTGIACTQNTAKTGISIAYGTATWEDGDIIDVYLYYESAPALP